MTADQQRHNRLHYLLERSAIYSKFLADKLERQRNELQQRGQRKEKKERKTLVETRVVTRSGRRTQVKDVKEEVTDVKEEKEVRITRRSSRKRGESDYLLQDYVTEQAQFLSLICRTSPRNHDLISLISIRKNLQYVNPAY